MSDEFVCPRCGDSFSRKDTLLNHLKKKRVCPPTNCSDTCDEIIQRLTAKVYNDKTYDCNFCGKRFNLSSCRSKHRKICKKNPINIPFQGEAKSNDENDNNIDENDTDKCNEINNVSVSAKEIPNDNDVLDISSSNYVVLDKNEFDKMKSKLDHLENEFKKLRHTNQSQSSTTINGLVQYNNIQVNLNNFGQENISHLTHDFLSHCLMNPSKGFPSLIENIHYHKDVPENRNIRCKSLKQNIFEKYIDSEWRSCDASNTLDELIRKGYRILNTHYTQHFMNDPEFMDNEMKQRAMERFRFLSDKTCNDYFSVKRELRLLIKDKTMYLIASPDGDNVDIEGNVENPETSDS